MVVRGRSHLNASAMIKAIRDPQYHLTLLRRPGALHDMAVAPGYKASDNGFDERMVVNVTAEDGIHRRPSLDVTWPPHPSPQELAGLPPPLLSISQVKIAHLFKVHSSPLLPSYIQSTFILTTILKA